MYLTRVMRSVAPLLLIAFVCVYPHLQKVHAASLSGGWQDTATQDNPDEKQIRQVVHDSQFIEMLTIYTQPKTFDKTLLDKYWVPADRGGEAILQVQASVRRLLSKNWHYGSESENEQFEIRSVRILPSGDEAIVRTRERWYMPMVDGEGNMVKERNPILEYPARYRLRKVDGRWLIQWGSGPYRGED